MSGKMETPSDFSKISTVQAMASLSPVYWLGFSTIICAAVFAALCLPYKGYSLNFGNYGKAPLRVARFSGTQSLNLGGHWHPLSGSFVPLEVSRTVVLRPEQIEETTEGTKLHLVVKNPTDWYLQGLIVGSFSKRDKTSGRATDEPIVDLVSCSVPPYSAVEISTSFRRDIDPSQIRLLALVGYEK